MGEWMWQIGRMGLYGMKEPMAGQMCQRWRL